MKVYAIHERTRETIALYVELEHLPDDSRKYLTTGPDGDDEVKVVASGDEAPVFMRLGLRLALEVAAAIKAEPSDGFDVVTLTSWDDFVELVGLVADQHK